jgi:7-cyano-7-deazaguanine synthase
MDDKAIVMLSGGLDSATCLYWAKAKFLDVSAITFNYYGRLENEKRATARLAEHAKVAQLIEIDLPFVKETSDFFNGKLDITDADSRWSSYIPSRNLIFYSIASHFAEYLNVQWIVGGHNLHDVNFFKDASKDYLERINLLFKEACLLCNGRYYKIILPLSELDRKGIIKLALSLNLPIELTWSCHRSGDMHCGNCYACTQRLEAFRSLGLQDPAYF